ncbi:MAG: hypothetical protein ACYCSR_13710 [Thiomonas sp.]
MNSNFMKYLVTGEKTILKTLNFWLAPATATRTRLRSLLKSVFFAILSFLGAGLLGTPAQAVPAFARQSVSTKAAPAGRR